MKFDPRGVLPLLGLVAGLTYLYLTARAVDPSNLAPQMEAIRALQRLNAGLDRDLLRLRAGMLDQYDSVNDAVEGMRDAVSQLREEIGSDAVGERETVVRGLDGVAGALADHEGAVEHVKSDTATLRNSLMYLTLLSQRVAERAANDQRLLPLERELGQFNNRLLQFLRNPHGPAGDALALHLVRMGQLPVSVDAQPQVEALRVHGRLIMERARRLDDLLRDATGAALAREIASLDEAHAEWRRLRAVELRRDWNLIYALALTLFVYAGFMLWRLRVATRKLADSEEQYRHILAYAPDAIVSVNQAQQIVGFNAAAEATFGYRADEAIGQPLDLLLPDRCRASHGTHVRGFAKEAGSARRMTNPSGGELEARRKDGSLFAAEIGISKCTTNSGLTFTATVRDITERKRAEAEIRQLNAELEVRVLKRTAELSEANEKLTQTVETLRETQDQLVQSEKMAALGSLVAGISHEVNTPIGIAVTSASSLHERLNALRASFEEGAMKRSMLEDFIAYADQAADILSRNLRRASDLIGSFKRVAVDQSSDHWENIALHEYVDEVLVSLRPKLKHTAVHVTNAVPDDLTIYTNPGAIYQVLSNLILNSITHAFDGGQRGSVLIEASQVGSFLHLSYRDDGKGIPAEHLPRVFDPFFTTRRGAGGSGLGLHIVYNLVTGTLRGRIDVSSEAGKGVQFRIRLPLNEERAPA